MLNTLITAWFAGDGVIAVLAQAKDDLIDPAPPTSKVGAYLLAIVLIAAVAYASMMSSKRGHRD